MKGIYKRYFGILFVCFLMMGNVIGQQDRIMYSGNLVGALDALELEPVSSSLIIGDTIKDGTLSFNHQLCIKAVDGMYQVAYCQKKLISTYQWKEQLAITSVYQLNDKKKQAVYVILVKPKDYPTGIAANIHRMIVCTPKTYFYAESMLPITSTTFRLYNKQKKQQLVAVLATKNYNLSDVNNCARAFDLTLKPLWQADLAIIPVTQLCYKYYQQKQNTYFLVPKTTDDLMRYQNIGCD